jgi:hypothetical protein
VGFADFGPIPEFVLTVRADPHVVHSCGREYAHVLFRHESITISTLWNSAFPLFMETQTSHKISGHGYQSRIPHSSFSRTTMSAREPKRGGISQSASVAVTEPNRPVSATTIHSLPSRFRPLSPWLYPLSSSSWPSRDNLTSSPPTVLICSSRTTTSSSSEPLEPNNRSVKLGSGSI